MGEAAALFPDDINDFFDLAALPGGNTALLWEEDSKGCIGRAIGAEGFAGLKRRYP